MSNTSELIEKLVQAEKVQQKQFREVVESNFRDKEGKLSLPDGEGGYVEAQQHKGNGMLITEDAAKVVDQDILRTNVDSSGTSALIYHRGEVPVFEIHVKDGVAFCFNRFVYSPEDGLETEFIAHDFQQNHVGFGPEPVGSVVHWIDFVASHNYLSVEQRIM